MKHNRQGFNLIEIAVVLAVIGLVIGGIYMAASSVMANQRKQKAQVQLLQMVQNIRGIYATQPNPTANYFLNASTAVALGLVPTDMIVNNSMRGAYGTVRIELQPASQFRILFNDVDQGACVEFFAKNFGSRTAATQIGLISVKGINNALPVPAAGYTTTHAMAHCAGDPVDMEFVFSMRS